MSEKRFPVVELFGPVIEGEGPLAGIPTTFIRFGLCDFRCTWCDSMHAVLPERVKAEAKYQTIDEIVTRIKKLSPGYSWVTFSGGNPAIHDLRRLVEILHVEGYQIKVETQGTLLPEWFSIVDLVVVSPKPPSSEMVQSPSSVAKYIRQLRTIQEAYHDHAVKIVVGDSSDLEYAFDVVYEARLGKVYLSCLTLPDDTRNTLGERYRWLCDASLKKFRGYPHLELHVLPQLHVVAYLHRKGV